MPLTGAYGSLEISVHKLVIIVIQAISLRMLLWFHGH